MKKIKEVADSPLLIFTDAICGQSPTVVDAALEVLAGNYPAKGEYQYKLDLK